MTITQNDITQLAARRLISGPLPNEKAIQLWLAMLLVSLGYKVKIEHPVRSGHMDIFLPERRVVIETKPLGEAAPNNIRDPEAGETQFQQCQRYVRDGWALDRNKFKQLRMGRGLPWKAILTDGRLWWMWQWEILPNCELGGVQTIVVKRHYYQIVAKRHYNQEDKLVACVQWLIRRRLQSQPIRLQPQRRRLQSQSRLPGFGFPLSRE